MQDYISGILDKNEATESFHGIAFSRKLSLRTMVGKTMEIHDLNGLASNLRVGSKYDIIVAVMGVEQVRAFTHSRTMSAKFSGTIRDLRWQPEPEKYQIFDDAYLNDPMSIVGTVNGHVLLSRLLLGGVAVGNAVTWGKDTFALVAVYS